MDVFVRQLRELISPSNATATPVVSAHCKRVAVKLLRCFKNGTRGSLELRYLLEDLLSSLPDANTATPTHEDPYKDIRTFAKLFTGQDGVKVPLKSKPKRPASIDASGLVDGTKRTKVDVSPAVTQKELADIQLLYDLFNDISCYSSLSKPKISFSQLLSQALTVQSNSSSVSSSVLADGAKHETSQEVLIGGHLQKAIKSLVPSAPRGQALRDQVDALFTKAEPRASSTEDGDATTSRLDFLEGLADILARLCAPIRDDQIKSIKNKVASGREYLSLHSDRTKLDQALKDAEKNIRKLVQDMQHDLRLFNMGITVATTNEAELRDTIKREAMEREKKIITKIYGQALQKTGSWAQKLNGSTTPNASTTLSKVDLARCLVEALFKPQPMIVQLAPADNMLKNGTNGGGTTGNTVPPIFHFAAKHLFVTQNRLQAFTILATLSTIVPPSVGRLSNGTGNSPSDSSSWSGRVWTLLNSEMLDDQGNTTATNEPKSHVKIANLADEIVKVVRDANTGAATVDEEKIRASVNRMLRLEDRVFALLHGRLKAALEAILTSGNVQSSAELQVKGYSVSPLPMEIAVTARQLSGILDWASVCWSVI